MLGSALIKIHMNMLLQANKTAKHSRPFPVIFSSLGTIKCS